MVFVSHHQITVTLSPARVMALMILEMSQHSTTPWGPPATVAFFQDISGSPDSVGVGRGAREKPSQKAVQSWAERPFLTLLGDDHGYLGVELLKGCI